MVEKQNSIIEAEGVVTKLLRAAEFLVKLTNNCEAICHVSGQLRRGKKRISLGDRVLLEISKHDLNERKKGRIIRRLHISTDEKPSQ
ncbi:S1 domain-containing protein [Wolbachia endosymbiont of Pentidionis agamae]|uniref:translation initiation factor IF-1 n=1 Tax=Wolbachia endosymbiont of Pentidionis agamae TaxID=3110435 RepID=UPI002FD682F9